MRAADRRSIAEAFELIFAAGPPDQRATDGAAWELSEPQAGSFDPLVFKFARVMAPALSRRTIGLIDATGRPMAVSWESSGRSLVVTPTTAWNGESSLPLFIAPHAEGIIGNRIGGAFDVEAETDARCTAPILRPIVLNTSSQSGFRKT